MADIARLGLEIDTSQVKQGTISLHQLTGAAGQASAAAQRLAGASQAEAVGQRAATVATQAHTAAITANNAAMRMGSHVRTNMIYQLNDVGVSLASGMNPVIVAVQQLPQMLQFGLKPAIESITGLAKGLVTSFWPLAAVIGAVAVGVAGLTYEINKTTEVQVGFLDVALAGWQLFAEGVAGIVAPVFGAIGSWLQQGWDAAAPILKNIGNTIIGTFAGAFEAIKAIWSGLPPALGDILMATANNVILAVQNMINSVGTMINDFLAPYNAGLEAMGQAKIPTVGQVSLPSMENPYQGAFNGLGTDVSGAFAGAQRDYLGDAFGAISQRAQDIAAARKEVEDLGGATQAANDNANKLANDGLKSIADKAFNVAEGLRSALQGIGSGLFGAIRQGGDIAGSVLDMLMDKLSQFASSWLDNIVNNGIDALFGGLGNIFGGMGGGMGGISSVDPYGSTGMGYFPGFANGTNSAPGGLSWVGERGPELVNLPRGSQVFNNQQSMGMAANQNRPVNFQTNIINNAGVEVVERSSDDGQGGVRQEIVLNRAVANAIGKPGPAQRAVRQTGRLVTR